MKLSLTKRQVIVTSITTERELEVGMEVHYYFHGNQNISNPSIGYIHEDSDGMYIEWDDSDQNLRLDGSDRSNEVLSNCGWGNN